MASNSIFRCVQNLLGSDERGTMAGLSEHFTLSTQDTTAAQRGRLRCGRLQQPLPREREWKADVMIGPGETVADLEQAQWRSRGIVSGLDTKATRVPV